MTTSFVETFGTVHPDGTLELDHNLPAAPGRVKVRVEYLDSPTPATESLVDFVDRTRRELTEAGHKFMNEEEVNAWVEELRADDDRIEEAYRQAEGSKRPAQ